MPTKLPTPLLNIDEIRDKKKLFLDSADQKYFRKYVDKVLGVSEGNVRTDLEVSPDIDYITWEKATHEARRQYLRNMCFSVWNGSDGKSQSRQILNWINGLIEDKNSSIKTSKTSKASKASKVSTKPSLTTIPEETTMDGGYRIRMRKKSRKNKSHRKNKSYRKNKSHRKNKCR